MWRQELVQIWPEGGDQIFGRVIGRATRRRKLAQHDPVELKQHFVKLLLVGYFGDGSYLESQSFTSWMVVQGSPFSD